ncbi:MAG: hypothetical protein HIU93_09080 [Acidobacteria bacterium]|nr:hypothetical protein [Acidobacteriota bacterium]
MRTGLTLAVVLLVTGWLQLGSLPVAAQSDSTAKIQAMLDAPGTMVNLPAGVFIVGCAAPLVLPLPSNKVVRGAGTGATTLLACPHKKYDVQSLSYSGSGPYTILVKIKGDFSLPDWNAYAQPSVIAISGAPKGYSGSFANPLIVAPNTIRLIVRERPSMALSNQGRLSAGLYPIQAYDYRSHTSSKNLTVENLTMSGNCPPASGGNCAAADRNDRALAIFSRGATAAANAHTLVFRNVIFRDSWEDAVRIDSVGGTNSNGFVFDHDQFLNAGWHAVEMYGVSNFRFTNNRVINYGWNSDTADALAFRGNGGGPQRGYIIANNFTQTGTGSNNFALEAVYGSAKDFMDKVSITGNIFDANHGAKTGNGISLMIASGVILHNRFINGAQQNHRDGFEFDCLSCEIGGNVIDGGTMQLSPYCLNNVCVDAQSIDVHDNVVNQTSVGQGVEFPALGVGGGPAGSKGYFSDIKLNHNTVNQDIPNNAPGNVIGIGLGMREGGVSFTPLVNLTVENNILRAIGGNPNTTAFGIYGTPNQDASSAHWIFRNNTTTGYAVHARALGVNVAGKKIGSMVSDLKFENERTDHPDHMFIDQSGGSQPTPSIVSPIRILTPPEPR